MTTHTIYQDIFDGKLGETDEQIKIVIEYGDDFDGDMAKMAAHPKTQEWWDWMMPLQVPVAEKSADEWWHTIEEVFHHD